MNKDAKYSLGIMREELKSEFICPEIKYAFKASIKALEKQIPKEPIQIGDAYGVKYGKCPNCRDQVTHFVKGKEKYCEVCGQRLLWED